MSLHTLGTRDVSHPRAFALAEGGHRRSCFLTSSTLYPCTPSAPFPYPSSFPLSILIPLLHPHSPSPSSFPPSLAFIHPAIHLSMHSPIFLLSFLLPPSLPSFLLSIFHPSLHLFTLSVLLLTLSVHPPSNIYRAPSMRQGSLGWRLAVHWEWEQGPPRLPLPPPQLMTVMAMRRTTRTTVRCASRVGRSSCATPARGPTTSSAWTQSWRKLPRASGAVPTV